jgi:iron-regulated transporter 1
MSKMGLQGISRSTRNILWSRLLTHSGDQAWDFAVPLVLATTFPHDLGTVALYYLLVRFAHMLLVTRVCALMDRWNRLRAIRLGIGAQTLSVTLATVAIHALLERAPGTNPLSSQANTLAFTLVVAAGLLGSTMMDVAVSQDWLPTLVPRHELAHVNSHLKQIDLFTELSAPVAAGLLLALGTQTVPLLGIYLVAAWNLVSFIPEYRLLRAVYFTEEGLTQRTPLVSSSAKTSLFHQLAGGWRDFLMQPSAAAMVSYALLWLTILSPHGVLLASWLKTQWDLPEAAIGAFRGLGAVFGLLATLAFPRALTKLSLVAATRLFIVWEALCLLGAAVAFSRGEAALLWFAGFVLLSRIGLYGFSLGETEIRQLTIQPEVRGRVNGFAQALTSLATLGVYGSGAVLDAPSDFSVLVYGSVAFVCLGALSFCLWSWSRQASAAEAALAAAPKRA